MFPASVNVGAHKYSLNEELKGGEWIHCPVECSGKQGIKRENEIQPETEEGGFRGDPDGRCRTHIGLLCSQHQGAPFA